jgi:hypothetical protein
MNETWQKSSYSGSTSPDCVECRTDQGRVLLRDSQHPDHGYLAVPGPEWRAFLASLANNEL